MGKKAKAPKPHGWENHNKGKPPFPGAAPPIHMQQGGRFLKKTNDVKKSGC